MKRHRILQIGCYMFVLGLGMLFCFVPACKFLESKSVEEPTKTDTEDIENPADTDAKEDDEQEDPVDTDAKDDKEEPVEPDEEDVADPVETDAEDDEPEDPVKTDAEDDEQEDAKDNEAEDPVETDAEDDEAEDTKDDEPEDAKELRYAENTLIFFRSGRYRYIARVTKDTDTEAKEVPVHIFVEELREEIGDSLAIDKVRSIRKAPPDGWGTRRVALEYFENAEWTFSWDVQEMENHYLLSGSDEDERRVEFTHIRFRIPVQR